MQFLTVLGLAMTGHQILKDLKSRERFSKKDLFGEARILLNKVDALRIDSRSDFEKARDLLGAVNLAYFPQDRGKTIFADARAVPLNTRELPYFVWLKVKPGVSIGFRRSRAIDAQKRRYNALLRRRKKTPIVDVNKTRRG